MKVTGETIEFEIAEAKPLAVVTNLYVNHAYENLTFADEARIRNLGRASRLVDLIERSRPYMHPSVSSDSAFDLAYMVRCLNLVRLEAQPLDYIGQPYRDGRFILHDFHEQARSMILWSQFNLCEEGPVYSIADPLPTGDVPVYQDILGLYVGEEALKAAETVQVWSEELGGATP